MNTKKKKKKYKYEDTLHQSTHCACGFPIPPTVRTLYEGFFFSGQIYIAHDLVCMKCGIINTKIG